VVYLDLSEITRHRKTKLEGPALAPEWGGGHRHINSPGSRRVQKLLQRLTPADPCEDPYLVALLIAMAQEQRMDPEEDSGSGSDAARLPPPKLLLVTRPADTTWLHIYASNSPTELLDRLDHPSQPLPPATVVPPTTIYRRRLAFKPYDTLRQRLTDVVVNTRLVMDD
jgi:hypothetical protein